MTWLYVGFVAFILVMLILDLKVVNRHAHEIRARESLMFTAITVVMALGFAGCVYLMYEHNWPAGITRTLAESLAKESPAAAAEAQSVGLGFEAMALYLTAWVLEYSLSVDNLFVIAVIFAHFAVPAKYQHRVLFWGIMGALVLRGIMIAAGAALVQKFSWIDYVFGAFLLFTAAKMLRTGDDEPDPEHTLAVRLARKFFPITPRFHEQRFFVKIDGKRFVTPLFLVLVTVEFTDVIFAVDSIPAVFGVTKDPFLVFTSNVFAILGLRSLFFAVATALGSFRYLKVSLVFVLAFIGLKMMLHHHLHIRPLVSLAVVLSILLAGVVASLFASAKERQRRRSPMDDLTEAYFLARRNFRRIMILIVGSTIILFGLAIGFLPGPGPMVLVPIGLAILATEFAWAQRVQKKLLRQAKFFTDAADEVAARTNPWLIPPVLLGVAAAVVFIAHNGPWRAGLVYLVSLGIWFPLLFWTFKTLRAHRRHRPRPLIERRPPTEPADVDQAKLSATVSKAEPPSPAI